MNSEATQHLLLFLILWSFVAGVCITIGRRKGVSPLAAIVGSFPLWLALFAYWLLRQPDIRDE